MKKLFYYIFIGLFLTGCSEEYDVSQRYKPALNARYLFVNISDFTFSWSASTTNFKVRSIDTPWKFDNSIDWIALSPSSGNSDAAINMSVSENTIGDVSRLGIFYLKSDVTDWNYETPIPITQEGAVPTISFSKLSVEFSGAASSDQVIVNANCTWEATASGSWLHVTPKDNQLFIQVDENTTNNNRTAYIVVNHTGTKNVSKTITVQQYSASIKASNESLVFNNIASSVNITINSEVSWTASTSNSWIELSPTSGTAGNSTLQVSVAPNTSSNERNGYVYINIGGKSIISIVVRQRGIFVETEQKELTFAAAGETKDLRVLSNTNWTVSSVPEWITVNPTEGSNDGVVKVTAQENPYTSSRIGTIRLTQKGLTIGVDVIVTQVGKYFDINTTVLKFTDKASTQNINIKTDGTWTAKSNDSWITVDPSSAHGNSTLSVSVTENTGDNERSGSLILTMGDKTETVNVVQGGKYLIVTNQKLNFNSKGGTIDVTISTNDTWTATVEDEVSWIKLSKTSGTEKIYVSITATDNPSVNSRTATIIFKTLHGQSVKVIVTQSPRYLTIDTQKFMFYAKGGTSEAATIQTDGAYKITCSDAWFTVKQTNNIFTVTAAENTTANPRIGTITIALTDLVEGSYALNLEVIQLVKGGTFLRQEYESDQNMDEQQKTITITLNNFEDDENMDSQHGVVTIIMTGFSSDTNLDTNSSNTDKVSKKDFEEDTKLD